MTAMIKKTLQRLHFLRCLKKMQLPQQLLVSFYRSAIESVLTYLQQVRHQVSADVPHGSMVENRKALQCIVRTTERIIGMQLHRLEDIYQNCCTRKAASHSSLTCPLGGAIGHYIPIHHG